MFHSDFLVVQFTYTEFTYRRVTRGGERERSPLPFFKTKKGPSFCKKCPDYIQLWVKFLV